MHWPSPAQRPRIAEIRDNLTARIAEAEREGWHGEAEGLKISLAGAEDKLSQIDRRSAPAGPVSIGMPASARVSEGAPPATSATPGDRP
jgi:hypothetical protein